MFYILVRGMHINHVPLIKSLGEKPNRILFGKRPREKKVFYILIGGVDINDVPLNKSLGENPNRILFGKRPREQNVFYILVKGRGTYKSCTPK